MKTLYCVVIALLSLSGLHANERPNILFITADDLGPQLECYGDPHVKTPHLDALAASGARFDNGYVTSASCSPSRSSMLTGLYPHTTGQFGLSHVGYRMRPGIERFALPKLLREAGYHTARFGKLHVEPEESMGFHQHNEGNQYLDTRSAKAVRESSRRFFTENKTRPFFMMFNFTDPHKVGQKSADGMFVRQAEGLPAKPCEVGDIPPFPAHGEFNTRDILAETAGYYNAVARLDSLVGILLEELDAADLRSNTIIAFVGDHGPPVSRGKSSCYEFGVKVPYLLSWPGKIKPGVRKQLVSTVDFAPTFLTASGLNVPNGTQGKALQPSFDDLDADGRQFLATEFNSHESNHFFPIRTIRDARYKLIANLTPERTHPALGTDGCHVQHAYRSGKFDHTETKRVYDRIAHPKPFELYDLENDPREWVDLAASPEHAAIRESLLAALGQWQAQTRDPLAAHRQVEAFTTFHDLAKRQRDERADWAKDHHFPDVRLIIDGEWLSPPIKDFIPHP